VYEADAKNAEHSQDICPGVISEHFLWEMAGLGTVFNFNFTIFAGRGVQGFFNNL